MNPVIFPSMDNINPIQSGIFQTANDPGGGGGLLPFYSDFKIKSSENSCKNNIFVILFKIDIKYIKRRRILMRI